MAITKPPVLPAWADAGDKVQPSNAELSVGWPVSSTPPSRQRFNWVLNYVANAVRYFSRRGMPDYDAAETYMTGDRIIGDDGKTYRSLIDNNTAQTPSTSPTKWERWAFSQSDLGANAQTQPYTAFTTTGATGAFVLTPSPALTAYAANQRFRVKFHVSGNGSDTINVSGLGAKSIKQYNQAGAKVVAAIFANQLVDVEYDGVDFVLLDPVPSGLSSPFISYGAATTLTDTALGKAIALYGASPYTITLPVSTAANSGGIISFTAQQGSAVLTISGQSAQTIQINGSAFASVQLGVGDQMTLVSGGSGWYVMSISGIGVGQRWKTPARAFNTTYTNTTGRPIYVGYTANFQGLADVIVNVDSTTQWYERVADSGSGNGWGCGGAIVPPGSTYAFSYTGTTTITGITFRELS
jgi:hypothetical protein